MLSALDTNPHATRLRNLTNSFRAQERFMTRALGNLQAQLDAWHEANECEDLDLIEDLRTEHNELAIERSHIRLAIDGARDELAQHEYRLQPRSNDYEQLRA